jgi:hypothetical protein
MSMVVSVAGYKQWDRHNVWYIAAYDGDMIRGINEIQIDTRRGTRLAYLNVYGNAEDNITFKLFSADGKVSIDLIETYILEPDGTIGLPSDPFIFSLSGFEPCITSTEISGDINSFLNDKNEIHVAESISLGATLNNPEVLQVMAGRSIELKSGFEVLLGKSLYLTIQPCTNE